MRPASSPTIIDLLKSGAILNQSDEILKLIESEKEKRKTAAKTKSQDAQSAEDTSLLATNSASQQDQASAKSQPKASPSNLGMFKDKEDGGDQKTPTNPGAERGFKS